ncbi:MAG: TolC family protein [Elusimicrobia bacterium]|nr:TolC family protein [Elusimicrobiota bacterium]
MTQTLRFLFPLLFLALSLSAGEPTSMGSRLDLKHCYDLAVQQSEPLKRQREDIVRSQSQARAALGGAFPHVSWEWRDIRQDGSGMDSGGIGSLLEKNQIESKFSLQQPLFTGLKEFSAYAGFKRQEARDEWRLRQAELQLYDEVSRAFYDVVALESALVNNATSVALSQDRLAELTSFYRLGKSREGEVFSAESQWTALKAIHVRLKGQIRVARETLSFLLGQEVGAAPLVQGSAETPEPVARYLTLAARRPDLEAQRQEVLAQTLRVRYEKGSYWPIANLSGNYYTQRPSFYDPIQWDVMLNLDVPLFQGGTVAARVKDARSGLQQAQLSLDYLERQIQSDVKKAYEAWTASLEESQALGDATHAAQKSYDAQRREYRLGLVTNLDVINAMNLMQTAKRAWDDADVEAQRRYVALVVVTGALP